MQWSPDTTLCINISENTEPHSALTINS